MHSKQYPLSDPLFRFKSTLILRIHRLSSGSFIFETLIQSFYNSVTFNEVKQFVEKEVKASYL